MNDNPIDVSYKDVNKKYYTIDEVSNILKIDQSKIVFYFEKLNDFLNITSVGMYQLFDDNDIQNLEIVKNLDKEKRMNMKEIREYLDKNKPEVLLKKESNNKLDQSVLNIFQTFASALMEQNTKIDIMHKNNLHLVESINNIAKYQQKIEKELQEQKEINQKYQLEHNEDNKNIVQELNTIKREVAITKDIDKKIELYEQQIQEKFEDMNNKLIERDVKIVEDLSKKLEQRKKESEEQSQNQGFFSKLFNKKK